MFDPATRENLRARCEELEASVAEFRRVLDREDLNPAQALQGLARECTAQAEIVVANRDDLEEAFGALCQAIYTASRKGGVHHA